MTAKNRGVKSFVSNYAAGEYFRLGRSDESGEPIQAMSDGDSVCASMPFGKYTSAEVLQLWTETLKQFEETLLQPFYERLTSSLEKVAGERLEQQCEIMQAFVNGICDKICASIEKRFAQLPCQSAPPPLRQSRPRRHHTYEV